MGKRTGDSRGFTLIAALLLTLLLSAMAVGLIYLVTNEQRMGNNDLEGNIAYYGAEAGIENLTSQLSQLYQTSQSPNAAAINALTTPANWPTAVTGSMISGMTFPQYSITWPAFYPDGKTPCPGTAPNTNPCGGWDIVGSGSNQGMVASLIPFTLTVAAQRQSSAGQVGTNALAATGATINLTRTVEVALLPAFEFGVFCDGDCDYFAGPNFNFGGRVHTNGNLYLASGSSLTFTDKIAAVGNIVTDRLENGWLTNNGYPGSIYVPAASGACPSAPGSGPVLPNCAALPSGSWSGGIPTSPPGPPTNPLGTGAAVGNWVQISHDQPSPFNPPGFSTFIVNGATGATKLQLPFVNAGNVGAIEIIRRPQATDTPLLSSSRLYTEASIRVLLADQLKDLHPDRGVAALDADDVQLGITTTDLGGAGAPTASAKLVYTGAAGTNYMYFGMAQSATNGWIAPTNPGTGNSYGWTSWPLLGQITTAPANVVGGPAPSAVGTNIPYVWLRVEFLSNVTNNWVGVTRQWLGYGFGRTYDMPPTAPWGTAAACTVYPAFPPGQCSNPISPAILILQQLQPGTPNSTNTTGAGGASANNWIPINFYDAREGEPRDNQVARTTNTTGVNNQTVYTPCGASGVMDAVELDVGNLWLWLQKTAPYNGGSGLLVNSTNQNGYILYFSDRRGMIQDPNAPAAGLYNKITGASGLEDTVNSASATGVPDNALEAPTYYGISPEDVSGDGFLDTYGEKYLGAGFGLTAPPASVNNYMAQPYSPSPANAITLNANQVSCNSYKFIAPSTVETYPGGTGTPNPTVPVGNPQNNLVTAPRHALRLVDGGMNAAAVSYLPHPALGNTGNGFTVTSEEPVYVFGDYNSGIADPLWPAGAVGTTPHSAAAIIADSVTLLSNPPSAATTPTANVGWTDAESFLFPGDVSNRPGNTSYYRMAIAAGKSIPFPLPGWANAVPIKDFGTDGGMHNFLRYLENRGANGAIVNYAGSLISMYYSQYHTGVFKCCTVVYNAPVRNYFFDTQFLNPANLPPGTPSFQDVVSLSAHQSFTPQ
jgi:hypothetical protein